MLEQPSQLTYYLRVSINDMKLLFWTEFFSIWCFLESTTRGKIVQNRKGGMAMLRRLMALAPVVAMAVILLVSHGTAAHHALATGQLTNRSLGLPFEY